MLCSTALLLNNKRSIVSTDQANNNQACPTMALLLFIYSKCSSPPWDPSTCASKLMQVFLHQNCVVQEGSMYLDSLVDLVKMTRSSMIQSYSHHVVLNSASLFFLLSHEEFLFFLLKDYGASLPILFN